MRSTEFHSRQYFFIILFFFYHCLLSCEIYPISILYPYVWYHKAGKAEESQSQSVWLQYIFGQSVTPFTQRAVIIHERYKPIWRTEICPALKKMFTHSIFFLMYIVQLLFLCYASTFSNLLPYKKSLAVHLKQCFMEEKKESFLYAKSKLDQSKRLFLLFVCLLFVVAVVLFVFFFNHSKVFPQKSHFWQIS